MSDPLNRQSESQPLVGHQTQTKSTAKRFIADNAGLLLVMLSEWFFSMMNAGAKFLRSRDTPMSTFQVMLVRMAITGICSSICIPFTDVGSSILGPKGVRWLLIFRGCASFVSIFGSYYSLQYLSLPDLTVLFFLTPFCTAIFGSLFLKETLRISQIIAGLVSLIGVILIARPPFLFGSDGLVPVNNAMERTLAVCVALMGVFGGAGSYVFVRAICEKAHPLVILAHYGIFCTAISAALIIITKTPLILPTPVDLPILIMIGVLSFIAQVVMTTGLQFETAGRASMGIYTSIISATIFEYAFFHTPSSWLSIPGIGLILLSAIYITMTKGSATPTTLDHANQSHLTLDGVDELETGTEFHEPCSRTNNTF